MTDSVATFVRESGDFLKRHPGLNDAGKSFGGLAWGLMRAVAECPNCPGHYRVPITEDGQIDHSGAWDRLACSQCRHVWLFTPTVDAETLPTKRKKARTRAERPSVAPATARTAQITLQPRETHPSTVEGA